MSARASPHFESPGIRKDIMVALGEPALREFNVAFALMSLIPMGIGVYVLAARLFTIQILEGLTGLYVLIALLFTLLGFIFGRRILEHVLAKLIDASIRLRQHETVKSAFIANVAYELRPPLAAVQMSLKNVTDGLLGPLSGSQYTTIKDCHEIVGRLTRLTTDLIDLTDVGQGKPKLQQDVFALQEVVRDAVRLSQSYLNAHRLTVKMELPETAAMCFGDRVKLLQAFGSILDYVIRWSSEGGVLTIQLGQFPQDVRLIFSHDIATHQAEAARALSALGPVGTEGEPTLGLGLRLAADIVQLHHGRFWIEGQPGHDSQLIVSLPVLDPERREGVPFS